MLGIGQLVAGIAHQIANPLDGLQNCLHIIGEGVRGDSHLTEYVKMMGEALARIERTANRVQVFAQPHGITLGSTDVNAAVESSPNIALIHELHQQLLDIWAKRGGNMEEIINELRAWCKEAEASGMQSLREFADTLKSYATPQTAAA